MKPTPKADWLRIGTRLLKQLGIPCQIEFTKDPSVFGYLTQFGFPHQSMSTIVIRQTVRFKYPEDLILHEAAHYERGYNCSCDLWVKHCECWATILVRMYRETGTPLPAGTTYEAFAKVAGITLIKGTYKPWKSRRKRHTK